MSPTGPPPRSIRNWTLALCVLAWVCGFAATHLPRPPLAGGPLSDKWLHMVGYFFMVAILAVALAASDLPRRKRALAVIVLVPLYAAFDEVTQPLVGRGADFLDWIMDMCGALAALAAVETILARRGWR